MYQENTNSEYYAANANYRGVDKWTVLLQLLKSVLTLSLKIKVIDEAIQNYSITKNLFKINLHKFSRKLNKSIWSSSFFSRKSG